MFLVGKRVGDKLSGLPPLPFKGDTLMRKKIIAGNWKMNKNIKEAVELVTAINNGLKELQKANELEIIVSPPYTAINKVSETLQGSQIKTSGQNLFWEDSVAFTGAISAPMLKEAGAEYVIIGHSERRRIFHDTDEEINKKIKTALKHSLIPILCIGETLEEREAGKMENILICQLALDLNDITKEELKTLIIAYEPVWAIGTGKTATPNEAEEAHVIIRKTITEKFGQDFADAIRILYGGSAKPKNSKELLSQPNIDGALIGGASLKAEDFLGIIEGV